MGIILAGDDNDLKINNVLDDSPAAKAGLQAGDLLTEIDENHIASYRALMEQLSQKSPGDTIKVRYIRDGKAGIAEVVLGEK